VANLVLLFTLLVLLLALGLGSLPQALAEPKGGNELDVICAAPGENADHRSGICDANDLGGRHPPYRMWYNTKGASACNSHPHSAAFVDDGSGVSRVSHPAQVLASGVGMWQAPNALAPPLSVQKLDQWDPLPATWRIRYTISITNTGELALSSIVVTDTLPAGTFFVSASMGGVHDSGMVIWAIPNLSPGFNVELHLTLGTYSTLRGMITNTVAASALGTLTLTDTETTTVTAPPVTPTHTVTPTPAPTHPLPSNPTGTATPTHAPSYTPTATPARRETPKPQLPGAIPPPSPTPGLVAGNPPPVNLPPVIFVMLDWMNGDWANADYSYTFVDRWGHWQEVQGHPEYGALGGWAEFYWDEMNPRKGVYNWTKADQYIKKAQAMRVRLPDGRVVAKPVGIAVATWVMDENAYRIGTNRTPHWVASESGDSIISCYDPDGPWGPCKPFCTPRFSNTVWQYWFDQFIFAMGRHYDNNPEFYNLAFIVIATGADAETIERKNMHDCIYYGGNSPSFNDWVAHIMETYNRAFPNTPQFIQSTVHSIHYHAEQAAAFPSQMTGVKVGGLKVDVPNAEVRYDNVLVGGVTGFSKLWHQVIPTGYEPKHANGIEGSYWFFMEGLCTHPYMFDIQLPNIRDTYLAEQRTGFPILDFVRKHLGKTPQNTPDVWIVLRDTYEQDITWTGSDGIVRTYGPHHGDFEYWLYRSDSAPGSRTVALLGSDLIAELPSPARDHIYGWHSTRRTDEATGHPYMSFDVDDRYPYTGQVPKAAGGQVSWEITVTFVNHGTDKLSLEYVDYYGNVIERRITKGPALAPLDNWVDYTWHVDDAYFDNRLPGGMDFRLDCNNDGDEFVHRLIVSGQGL